MVPSKAVLEDPAEGVLAEIVGLEGEAEMARLAMGKLAMPKAMVEVPTAVLVARPPMVGLAAVVPAVLGADQAEVLMAGQEVPGVVH